MRIGIDVRYLSHGLVGGVHTYIENFVRELVQLGEGHTLFLYADTKKPFELDRLPPHVHVRRLDWKNPASSIYHDLTLWRHMRRDHLDVAHFPANYGFAPRGVRSVVTLHDAINILPLREIVRGHQKTARTIGMMTYLHLLSVAAVRRADLVLTVSSHAANEIAAAGGIPRDKIVAIPHAPTPDLIRVKDPEQLAQVRRRHALSGRLVLADALKNPAVLIRAWQRLPAQLREGRQIVFFARRPDVARAVTDAVASRQAVLLVQPSRQDLIGLYSMADAFIFPSWIEGFGIPLLEAMTCGAPVIASDRGSIPEVCGTAALLADAEDDEMFARHLTRVLGEPDVAQRLRQAGYARAADFSWRRTASLILAAYGSNIGNCASTSASARLNPTATITDYHH